MENANSAQSNEVHLTEEDLKVLLQCRSEAIMYRAIPFSVAFMASTHYLISKGFLQSSLRFGPMPKILISGFLGYAVGKMSYFHECVRRIPQLENSLLNEQVKAQMSAVGTQNNDTPNETPSNFLLTKIPPLSQVPVPPTGVYSSHHESSSVDVPFGSSMSESSPTGITDSVAQESEWPEEKQAQAPRVTYEELRNKNRGTYDVVTPQTPARPVQRRAPKTEGKKNKYGDDWED